MHVHWLVSHSLLSEEFLSVMLCFCTIRRPELLMLVANNCHHFLLHSYCTVLPFSLDGHTIIFYDQITHRILWEWHCFNKTFAMTQLHERKIVWCFTSNNNQLKVTEFSSNRGTTVLLTHALHAHMTLKTSKRARLYACMFHLCILGVIPVSRLHVCA